MTALTRAVPESANQSSWFGAAEPIGVEIHRNIPVPMADGTILRADLWLPRRAVRCAVLLQRTPYDKSFALVVQGGLDPARAVARGYGVMIQDVRGRFASAGSFEPFAHEASDGADTIAWITRQRFSDGRVAMYGGSYPGAVQLLAAGAAPPGLAAIVPHVTAADFHAHWLYQGGALQLGFALGWARNLAVEALACRERAGADVAALKERLDTMLEDPWGGYWQLPVAEQPLLGELVPSFAQWLEHPTPDGFWQRLSAWDRLDRLAVPGLHVAGWHDVFLRGSLAGYARLRELGRADQRLIAGPWPHAGWGDAVGEVIYGPRASRYALDPTDMHLSFYDSVLQGADSAVPAAPARLFTMGINRWRDEDGWPPTGIRTQRLHLRADGRLTNEPPATDEPVRSFRYDPADPVPTMGGATLMPGHEASIALGPHDQRPLHARPDVVLYTGEPLPRPLEVTGNVWLTLHAATSAADTDWTAKLLDVHPDGSALGVTDGILRARFRDSHPGPLEPGRAHRFRIDVGPTSMLFAAGHRIALEISSSNFPRFDRNPNSHVNPVRAGASDMQVAMQRLHHDAARPSFLELPARQS
jgi:putative CocE/NonD family hydrolase